GVAEFGRWIQDVDLPVYALGGIGPDNVASLTGSGACGLAGVEAIQSAFHS
ncbi:MAG: thiamine phosphate synthase, partial [Brevundimonas sp.]